MSGLVIINADDLGLTPGLNRGIFELVDAGVVTDTSLVANGDAFGQAVQGLKARGITGVGLHFCIVDGERSLTGASTLAGRDGRFFRRNVLFLKVIAQRQAMRTAIRRELEAQYARLTEAGLRVTHVDSHQHVHLFPGIAEEVVDFCRSRSIPALRLTRPAGLQTPMCGPTIALAERLRRLASSRGVTTVQALGFETGGRTSRASLHRHIREMASLPVCELIVHPGRADDQARRKYTHWKYDWDRESSAILESSDLIRQLGSRAVSFESALSRFGVAG